MKSIKTGKFHSTTWFEMDTFQINIILKKKLGGIFKGAYGRDQLAVLKTQAPTFERQNASTGNKML